MSNLWPLIWSSVFNYLKKKKLPKRSIKSNKKKFLEHKIFKTLEKNPIIKNQ